MFTDRFMKLPIKLHDAKQAELTGTAELEDSWEKILPFDITSWRPSFVSDDLDVEKTYITFKNGTSTLTDLHPKEFEKMLNDFVK